MLYVLYYNKKGGNQEGRKGGKWKNKTTPISDDMNMKMLKNLQKAVSSDKRVSKV